MPDRPKLQDVADLAGVSIGTASQALNNKSNVSSDTRARVLEAADQLGYQPQTRATVPERTTIATIGVLYKLIPQLHTTLDPFYSAVLSGAERECQRLNLNLMYASLEVDENSKARGWPPMLGEKQVDGLLILGAFVEETILQIGARYDRPVVLVDSYAPRADYDSVVTDNFAGAQTATRYLIERGHRRIGLIGSSPQSYPSIRERRMGFQHALAEHGLSDEFIEDSALHQHSAFAATLNLLNRTPQVSAILACNDDTAFAVVRAAHQLGLRVPSDLSVMGFDDMQTSAYFSPPLTTMRVDKHLMGMLGVRRLLDRAANPEQVRLSVALGTELIERESVRQLAE